MLILNNENTLEVVSDNYKKLFQTWITHSKTDVDIIKLSDLIYLGSDIPTVIRVFSILAVDWLTFRRGSGTPQHIKHELNESISTQNILYLLKILRKSVDLLENDFIDKKSLLNSALLAKNWVFKEYIF
jgi:hypothetical protein